MAKLVIHQDKIPDIPEMLKICPFGAMEEQDGKLTINAGCKNAYWSDGRLYDSADE